MTRRRLLALSALFVLPLLMPSVAAARAHRGWQRYPLLDAIEVIVHERQLIAIDGGAAGPTIRERLELGEDPLYIDTRGDVAVVITNKRVLATTADSARWMWTYIGVHESLPHTVLLGDSVALVLTDHRAIGLAAGCRRSFFAEDIGPNESVEDYLIGESVALIVTDKRLLGMSAFLPGFVEQQVGIHERIQRISALSDFATVATQRRLLVFQGPTASWQERRLSLH